MENRDWASSGAEFLEQVKSIIRDAAIENNAIIGNGCWQPDHSHR
jgi:hypothetical protein